MPAPAQPVVLRARNGVRDNAGTAFHLLVTHRIVADVAINVHSTRPVRVASVPAGPGTARVWDSASIPPLSSATTRTAAVAGLVRGWRELLCRKLQENRALAPRASSAANRASCKVGRPQCNMDRT